MIIQSIKIKQFRAMKDLDLQIGTNLTAIAGRNATMKSTLLGMLSQPFSISKESPLYGERTIDNYNYKSQFQEKFRLSDVHDVAGKHRWTLFFRNNSFYHNDYIEVVSANRKARGKKDSIRFINAEGKTKGNGYVQLPVVFLSLSRIYPIGESGSTKTLEINLTSEEEKLYIQWYKEILSISHVDNASVCVERKDSKRVFAGISDDTHDVFTSSAGEGNIGRLLIAILSFKRLFEKYNNQYKGGILLIDELDATLYGYSQIKLVRFLNRISKQYKIQVIFTTHSPIILKEVNKFQRQELKNKNIPISCSDYKYDCEIINLTPNYCDGTRGICGDNIHTAKELIEVINDINLTPTTISQKINVYLEDSRAISLLEFILDKYAINYEQFINSVDINLGWTNYVQLYEKGIPEFQNSLMILDCDVLTKSEYKKKRKVIEEAENILFLPIDVEAGMYKMLRNHDNYSCFQRILETKNIQMNYDVCFRDWVNDECSDAKEYKEWFKYIEGTIKDVNILFEVWYKLNAEDALAFVNSFIESYNILAEKQGYDYLISVPED